MRQTRRLGTARGALFSVKPQTLITIRTMIETETLPDEELGAQAMEWRRRALQGELHARGIAHQLESELRRRAGVHHPGYDTLDLRPLEHRQGKRPWWKPW